MNYLLIACLLCFSTISNGQTNADKILGTFMTEGNKGKVIVSKTGGKYFGTLVWTHIPNALDKNNPDKNKRNQPVAGSVILKNFIYDDGEWTSGTVYDPESGKTYSGKISLNGQNQLKLRGYVGIPAFGRTTYWTRTK